MSVNSILTRVQMYNLPFHVYNSVIDLRSYNYNTLKNNIKS